MQGRFAVALAVAMMSSGLGACGAGDDTTEGTRAVCAQGGARMFMEEHEGERVNLNRTDEIIAAGVEAVAVACPFCNIMLTDGMKQRDVEDKIQVLDIAELVAASIPDVPVDRLVRKKHR